MTKKKEPLMPKEGGPCRWCEGNYREQKRPHSSSITTSVFRFGVDNISTQFRARVFICDVCGHIEFFNVKIEREDPNA
jgi:hypothetical protein